MNIWIVSQECSGIQEAGGVKSVTYSLAKEFSRQKNKVTLFLPKFNCTTLKNIKNYKKDIFPQCSIQICNQTEKVSFSQGFFKNTKVRVVFVEHECFSEKQDIYVYTKSEEEKNPEHKKGLGHTDVNFLDILFQKSVAAFGDFCSKSDFPQIVHAQDASCACIGAFLAEKNIFQNTKSVVTIHNAGPAYHHEFKNFSDAKKITMLNDEILNFSRNGERIEPFLIASQFSKLITVSDFYAQEITDPKNDSLTDGLAHLFFEKNIKILGITNGIDFKSYNPTCKKCSHLPFTFNPIKKNLTGKSKCRNFLYEFCSQNADLQKFSDYTHGLIKHGFLESFSKDEILLSFHGRTVYQKGITVLQNACEILFQKNKNIKIIIVGQGDSQNVNDLIQFTQKFPGKAVYFEGYNKKTSRLCVASSDFIILPSFFEPCGLEDFIAQIYGTLPIAHKTGGLRKIINNKTGFLYEENTAENLSNIIEQIIVELIFLNPQKRLNMIQEACLTVKENFSWKKIVKEKYIPFFKNL